MLRINLRTKIIEGLILNRILFNKKKAKTGQTCLHDQKIAYIGYFLPYNRIYALCADLFMT